MKKLAVIREASCAYEDHSGKYCLYFATYVSEACSAVHWMQPCEAGEFMSAYGTMTAADLNGKVCWVEDSDGFLKVVGPAVI